jgi:hypothetical protein
VAGGGRGEEPGAGTLLDTLRRYIYGSTPMRDALSRSLETFRKHPIAEKRVLVLVSDGNSTDGDPLPLARELQQANVTMAAVYLTSDRAVPRRRLYDQAAEGWNAGQHTLFGMAARVAGVTHPIPLLASMGWEVPSSGECALYAMMCIVVALDEFFSLLLSARFGSADALLDIIGRVQLDFPPGPGGRVAEEVLRVATAWYRPLRFRKVDEEGARQAVLHRRPVLTTFCLSRSGWATFSQHFGTAATRSSVLTRSRMASHRSLPDDGGHAVVLVGCDPHSLTFLNSWGHQWGNNGSFGVENHTVLELDGASQATRVCFYDVYWLERDLTAVERQAYDVKVDEALHARAAQYPSIFELEARCPLCRGNSPIADFNGSVRQAVCPHCRQSFGRARPPGAGAVYARRPRRCGVRKKKR